MRRPVLAVLMTGLMASSAWVQPARAQMDSREAIALQNQILELRRDMQSLQAGRGGGYAASAPAARGGGGGSEIAAQLLDRVQALEEEVRRMRGQMDEQANSNRRAHDDLAKQITDLNFRVQQGGGAPASAPAASAPPSAPSAPPTAPRRTPEMAMQEGSAALARRDYTMAEAAAREVLAATRGAQGAPAQFLLAQSLAGRRDFAGAAVAYDDAYRRSPKGPRASDALLGLGSTLMALNDKAAACQALNRQRTEFPSRANDGAGLRSRAGC